MVGMASTTKPKAHTEDPRNDAVLKVYTTKDYRTKLARIARAKRKSMTEIARLILEPAIDRNFEKVVSGEAA